MRPRRFAAALAILALLLQALLPLAPARAERAVICGVEGPVVVLLDLGTGQPLVPADEHGCCAVCFHCAGCPALPAPALVGGPTGAPTQASAHRARTFADDGAPRIPIRVRGPPTVRPV